jgi:UDP-GlcNAc:undecaprenyl-phosphate GlcNAc-1-phosphate transferase
VLLLYFWSALVAFAGVGLSFQGGESLVIWMLCVLALVGVLISAVPTLRARSRSRSTSRV